MKIKQIFSDILQKTTYVVFLITHMPCVKATGIQSFHAVRSNEYPKSSCHQVSNIISTRICLATCGVLMDKIIMISHDESTKICMCCRDITGSDIIGSNWKTFVSPPCATGYVTNDLMSYQICFKYFPVLVSYESARTLCQAEGGNLIKIDSQEKFNIFQNYHAPIANNTIIQVWIESDKVGGQWQFHDGSPMPEICPISMSNGRTEVHLRARGSTSFTCFDAAIIDTYHYSCEYNRLLGAIIN